MAFREGLLQHIDLASLLARQAASARDEESKRLQNELLKQQLEAGKWNLQKEKDLATATVVPDKTANMLTGQYSNFLNLRQPLREMPGYVEGTNPAQYEAEQMAIRQALACGGGVRGGGGPSEAETNLMNQQANLMEEKARQEQYQRQGYGSAAANILAQQKIASELAGEQAKADAAIRAAETRSDAYKYSADKKAETSASAAAGKQKQKEADIRIAGRQADQKELEGYYKKLYSTEYWKGEAGGEKSLTATEKEELRQILPGVVKKAQLTGKPLDLTAFIESYINRNK
jgi:Tfp pilus assembly protein PilE